MINSIYLDNFKSLVDFDMNFNKFNCVVGLNGAGKSTLLQAMDFLSQLMRGDLEIWLDERQWEASDLGSKLSSRMNIEFKLRLSAGNYQDFEWTGSVNRTTLRCTTETITLEGTTLLKVADGTCFLRTLTKAEGERFPVVFDYQGSILSQLKEGQIKGALETMRNEILNIRSLDLLSPAQLRLKTRSAEGHLGLGGQRLAAYLHELGKEGRDSLRTSLSPVYAQLESIDTSSLRSGWKQLGIKERFGKSLMTTPARHINDGMLRLMAVFSQLASTEHFLLFDEIENGVNPELVEFLVDALVKSPHQVMVTTHSPLILNYLDDDLAKNSVIYLYKKPNGSTKAVKLFAIPSLAEKLTVMGAGEAFVDTQLSRLVDEINGMANEA